MKKLLIATALITALSGCMDNTEVLELKQDLATIKSNLGDHQYLGVDPKLKIEVSDIKVTKSSYAHDAIFTLNIQQLNAQYSVKSYDLTVFYDVAMPNKAPVELVAYIEHSDLDNIQTLSLSQIDNPTNELTITPVKYLVHINEYYKAN